MYKENGNYESNVGTNYLREYVITENEKCQQGSIASFLQII